MKCCEKARKNPRYLGSCCIRRERGMRNDLKKLGNIYNSASKSILVALCFILRSFCQVDGGEGSSAEEGQHHGRRRRRQEGRLDRQRNPSISTENMTTLPN